MEYFTQNKHYGKIHDDFSDKLLVSMGKINTNAWLNPKIYL